MTLWTRLKTRQLDGLKFRRQHPIEPYVLDFYCAEARLAVEIDGQGHGAPGQPEKDERRDRFLLDRGIRTLRIPASKVFQDIDSVLLTIAAEARGT